MSRSVWLALAASLLHGKAAGFPSLPLLLRGILGAPRAAWGALAGARFGGSRGRGAAKGAARGCRGGRAPLSGQLRLGGRGRGQEAWGASLPAFREQASGSPLLSVPARRVPEEALQGAGQELQPVREARGQRLAAAHRLLLLEPPADHGRGERRPRPQGCPLSAAGSGGRRSVGRTSGVAWRGH